MRRSLASALAIGLVSVGLAACGGGGGGGGGGSSQPSGTIKVVMTEFKFTPSDVSAKPGKVVFFLVNSGSTAHDMVVTGPDSRQVGRSELVQPGNTATLELDNLVAGSYPLRCDQPGHAEAGMKGTLTVA